MLLALNKLPKLTKQDKFALVNQAFNPKHTQPNARVLDICLSVQN